jgi:hypothetical protein
MLVMYPFFITLFCLMSIVNHLSSSHPMSDLVKISILYLTYRVAKTREALLQICFAISFALRLAVYHFNCELQLHLLSSLAL